MSYDLSSPVGQFKFGNAGWTNLLILANQHGWEPQGTVVPAHRGSNWAGNYLSNDGQVVSEHDARMLGLALERSLDDIPDQDVTAHKIKPVEGFTGLHVDDDISPVEYFSGANSKTYLREFIVFCKTGEFRIT